MIDREDGAGRRRVSAIEIAETLELPRPTDQQRSIIESEPGPALVIAGAGSGKTETMAGRVLWLLANGWVSAGQVLGLTFTRKAAGELAGRIRKRLGQLQDAGLLAAESDPFDPPVVATYNSFANTIYRDNAILLGRESDGAVLGEASAWQLARSIVLASRGPVVSTGSRSRAGLAAGTAEGIAECLAGLDKSLESVTDAVLSLSHELSENVADTAEVAAFAERFATLADLPNGGRGEYAGALELASSVGSLPVLLALAEQFAAAKAADGLVEYADQVALALQIVRRVPRVREEYRDRFRVVLLDEYQDTSVVQTWLLAELFAGHPVMAVGDPNQSIYGWRGASAANLDQFADRFGVGGRVREFALSTSWRNGQDILAAANTIVEPLVTATSVPVEELSASPTASSLPVEVRYEETVAEEARAAAEWLAARLRVAEGEEPPSAAMLFRTRRTQAVFIEALREAGVPYHVLGIGGLLDEPEIADLVSALAVVADPTAGSELVRLLAGSRWRIGVRDLRALSRVASWLRERDLAHRELDDEVRKRLRESVAEGEGGSVVDALDFLAHAPAGHGQLKRFSPEGVARLREAGLVFSRMRARSVLDLPDFVTLVLQEFRLDIEVSANETRSAPTANGSGPAPTATIEAFFDALTSYRAVNEGGGLGGFLSWLSHAARSDDLAPRPEDPVPGTVQLLTIHGAKGLEWDLVVVPRFVAGELPTATREANGWTSFGKLPFEFRGDVESLPVFAWREVASRKELLDEHTTFKAGMRARHELEERRLAYVAVTRARHRLLLTGSFWAGQTAPRAPSPYLLECADAGVIDALPEGSRFAEKPEEQEAEPILWPPDPLGARRPGVLKAAELVRQARPAAGGPFGAELELLLAERSRALSASERVELPTRIPASRFKDFVADPAAVASELRRPMPQKPYRQSRLGTLFHGWVEDRYGPSGSREVIDAVAGELDLESAAIDAEELARLQATFEASPWARLQPVEVERELHLPFAGQVVVCKIDAVYEIDGRYQIVDWKTGKAPRTDAELAERQLQLALYRLAFAAWKSIDPDSIDAVFFYVAEDRVIIPDRIYDREELLALWRNAIGAGRPPQ